MNRIKRFFERRENSRVIAKIIFLISGLASTVWFLIRVIPKPSRAMYPCMRATSPIMASFVIYLLSITGTVLFYKKIKIAISQAKYKWALLAIVAFIGLAITSVATNTYQSNAQQKLITAKIANTPIGVAYGIKPGRVVWAYNPDVTRDECTNSTDDYWFDDDNTNQEVVDTMMRNAILTVANKVTIAEAWNALFEYHDTKKGRSEIGYSPGDKIVIKLNLVRSYHIQSGTYFYRLVGSSPHLILALLRQLVNETGVQQSDIYVGDPFREMLDPMFDKLNAEFPNVNYVDNKGETGRTKTTVTTDYIFHTSDGQVSSRLPTYYTTAKYFINIPCLKSHDSAGITIAAKNHQGSVKSNTDPFDNILGELHYSFPWEGSSEMGQYRHLVDYMGHEFMGGNTVLNIVDALWSGTHSQGYIEKWHMPPFNNDWTSSIFVSQDRVAIEAVCFDFLYAEYSQYGSEHIGDEYPLWEGVTDYIEQAADPSKWPANIDYDPENDGSVLTSLGVCEHWNSATLKQYSRNLETGDGIELTVAVNPVNPDSSINPFNPIDDRKILDSFSCYPNPAYKITSFVYSHSEPAQVQIDIYSMSGKKVETVFDGTAVLGKNTFRWDIPEQFKGVYICKLSSTFNGVHEIITTKLLIN